jgi:YD repeat-containing protein
VGSGWGIDGIPQVIAVSTGAVWISGEGDTRFFSGSGTGPQTYTSPPEDFGTLVQHADGPFSNMVHDRTVYRFNASGALTGVTDRDGLTRGYGFDTQGRPFSVTAIDGSVTTLSDDATTGLLDGISGPGGRMVTLTHTGTDLTGITDSDGTTRTFGYDGAHRLTSDGWSPLVSAFGYDGNGLLNNVTLGQGVGTTSSHDQLGGGAGPGGTASGPAAASVTDGLNHKTTYTPDGRGRLLGMTQPGGATQTWTRDGSGEETAWLDTLNRATTYAWAAGDLVRTSHPDGSFEAQQYDPTFHEVTQTADARGMTWTATYNPTNGDMLSSSDALGNTTSNLSGGAGTGRRCGGGYRRVPKGLQPVRHRIPHLLRGVSRVGLGCVGA